MQKAAGHRSNLLQLYLTRTFRITKPGQSPLRPVQSGDRRDLARKMSADADLKSRAFVSRAGLGLQNEEKEYGMDCLITTLSLITARNFREMKYTYPLRQRNSEGDLDYETDPDKYISGMFTNEAPAKYLLSKKLEETYSLFDKIIILGTNECENDKIGDIFEKGIATADDKTRLLENKKNAAGFLGMTTQEYYEYVIRKHIKTLHAGDLSKIFAEKDKKGEAFIFLNVDSLDKSELLTGIQKALDEDEYANIYLDYTGGTRVSSLIALMLCRWLEVKNYKLSCVVYSDITKDSNKVRDITDIYGMFNAIIAHDKVYDPELSHVRSENQNESVKYGLREYRKNKRPEYIPSSTSDKPFAFVSYAHLDHDPAQAIIQRLQNEGYHIWYDEGISWGEYWEKSLKDNMERCSMAILLLSKHYFDSEYCIKELEELKDKPNYVIWLDASINSNDLKDKYPALQAAQGIEYQKYLVADFNRKLLDSMASLPEASDIRDSD